MLSSRQAIAKRLFDVVLSLIGLLLTGWVIVLAWILASLSTGANGMFSQWRVGLGGRLFRVYKIRTMRPQSIASESEQDDESWSTVTTASDQRVTRVGRMMRRAKIDELPQLYNVLLGQMSFVGPRPDVPGFADKLVGEDRVILTMRPGITGPATLKYRNEEEILASVDDPETYNRDVIFPDKVRLNRQYVQNWSFSQDIWFIWRTVSRIAGGKDSDADLNEKKG